MEFREDLILSHEFKKIPCVLFWMLVTTGAKRSRAESRREDDNFWGTVLWLNLNCRPRLMLPGWWHCFGRMLGIFRRWGLTTGSRLLGASLRELGRFLLPAGLPLFFGLLFCEESYTTKSYTSLVTNSSLSFWYDRLYYLRSWTKLILSYFC